VAAELETLSDHRYIELRYAVAPHGDTVEEGTNVVETYLTLKKLDEGLLMEFLYAQTWPGVEGAG